MYKLIANLKDREEQRVVVLDDEELREVFIEHPDEHPTGKMLFLGRLTRVVPSLGAAFVALGSGREGLLPLSEVPQGLHVGSEIIVQMVRPPRKNKGPRLSAQISLAGRFLVYLPLEEGVGVSRKLPPSSRAQLKELAATLPLEEGGLIMRTEAFDASGDELQEELASLVEQWNGLKERARYLKAPVVLWADDDLLGRVLRDYLNVDLHEALVDTAQGAERLKDYFIAHGKSAEAVTYDKSADLFEDYGLNRAIDDALAPRVSLPCGGSVVIETTEALTAIDVNSGRDHIEGSVEERALAVNMQALEVIARQVRLRNIGGIIAIDFIDLRRDASKEKLFQRAQELFAQDSEKVHVYPLSPLCVMEISRRRRRPDLRGVLKVGVANSDGMALRPATQVARLKRALRRATQGFRDQAVLAACSESLLPLMPTLLPAWEEELGVTIFLRPLAEFESGGNRIELRGSLAQVEARARVSWGEEVPRVYRRADFERL